MQNHLLIGDTKLIITTIANICEKLVHLKSKIFRIHTIFSFP